MNKPIVNITYIDTELGVMVACATEKGVCMLEFADCKHLDLELRQIGECFKSQLVEGHNRHFDALCQQLSEYFDGDRTEFDLALDLVGTEFQKSVWLSLLQIPHGCTTSYGKQARLIGKPSAVRAVANANGKNKVCIILPCHRVIGTDGKLTGYGGGLWRKERLLALEARPKREPTTE